MTNRIKSTGLALLTSAPLFFGGCPPTLLTLINIQTSDGKYHGSIPDSIYATCANLTEEQIREEMFNMSAELIPLNPNSSASELIYTGALECEKPGRYPDMTENDCYACETAIAEYFLGNQ